MTEATPRHAAVFHGLAPLAADAGHFHSGSTTMGARGAPVRPMHAEEASMEICTSVRLGGGRARRSIREMIASRTFDHI